jgi:hypothetical protein
VAQTGRLRKNYENSIINLIYNTMVEEKLELYAEFDFTDEADEAFSEKLSEFLDEEVSLKEIRKHGRRNLGN